LPGAMQQPRGTRRESNREFIARYLLNPTLVLSIYCLAAVILTLVKLAPGSFEQNGFHYHPLQNFAIFRNSFFHLIHHQDLYARFDAEQWDLYRYSPTFALLFAPFAVLPYGLGAVLWNGLNALALLWAIRSIPIGDEHTKMLVLWFVFLSTLNSISNAQSNALMAGLMLGAWNAQERKRPALSSFLIVLSVFVKLFGVFALLPCLLCQGRKRLLIYATAWGAIMAALPLVAVQPAQLLALYRGWYATVEAFSEARLGLSVMGFLRAWFHLELPQTYVVLAGAFILLAVALRGPRHDPRFRLLAAASVLIFVTIFNYAAESPTFVLAVTGCALWYFFQARTPANLALLVAVFLFTSLSSTDLVPRALRREFLETYVIKAVPCILVWIKLQYDMLRFDESNGLS
jgi:Glycosyltransferase family 87